MIVAAPLASNCFARLILKYLVTAELYKVFTLKNLPKTPHARDLIPGKGSLSIFYLIIVNFL